MALELNKIPQAVAQVMSGIDEGVSQASVYVDSARPPEKVVFSIDAIVALNSIDRIRTAVTSPSIKTTLSSGSVETISFNGDQSGLSPLPSAFFSVTQETTSEKTVYVKSKEDQSVGLVFDYPGPKSS